MYCLILILWVDVHYSLLSTLEHRRGVSSGTAASSLGEGQGSFCDIDALE